jgi:Zn-dependent protease
MTGNGEDAAPLPVHDATPADRRRPSGIDLVHWTGAADGEPGQPSKPGENSGGAGRKRRTGKAGSGFFGFLAKIGAKLLPVIAKVASAGKLALAAASFAAYSLLFTWKFAIAIIAMIVLHEGGHMLAMKRAGMRTRGIYLIPFIGGAAVTDSEFPSRRAEVWVALAGPVTGLGLSLICLAVYAVTGWPTAAALASWNALVNLFNMLPVTPLDGGRVVKSAVFSISARLGVVVMTLCAIAGALLAVKWALWIFVVVLPLSAVDLIFEWRSRHRALRRRPAMTKAQAAGAAAAWLGVAGVLALAMALAFAQPGAHAALNVLQG